MSSLQNKNTGENTYLIKDFLNTTLKEIMTVLDAECGSVFLFDQEKKELVLDSYHNASAVDIKDIKKRVGEGISGKVVEHKTPVLVRNIDADSRFNRNGFNHYHTKSFISIPLFATNEPIGVINIADKASREPFSEKDLLFAVTLCKYACVVVENILYSMGLAEEKEKLDKKKVLLEKYASMGKLAAGVVHEINNPLDGIIRYTNMLLSQINENSTTREYLLEIKKGLTRIGGITKSLLEFSHLVNSNAPKLIKFVDVYELIEDSLDVLKGKLNGDIRIVKKYNAKSLCLADMGLSHILINIIKNAIDAMQEKGILEISTDIQDSLIHIAIKDSGIGIPPEVKEHIFEPFYTTKGLGKGTGLGLAICKEIVNKYEGAIEVHSEQGKGSIFTILIPQKYSKNE